MLLSESWRKEGEDGVEEDDGYLTGETDPFMSSEEAMVVCPVEERDEREDLPPLNESVESTEVFKDDRLEILLTEERLVATASIATVDAITKGMLELYMLYGIFGDAEALL